MIWPWVYIATAGDDEIQAIQVSTGEILGRIKLNFGDEPVEIALSPDGKTLVSANYGSNTASIIDTASMREMDRVNLPSQSTVIMDRSLPRAYILQAQSNSLSIIDLSRGELSSTRTLEEAPERGAISQDGEKLYVITSNSPNLLVIDTLSLSVSKRIFVGLGAASIKVDTRTGLIYVGKNTGEIVVIDPFSLMYIDAFSVNGNASFLAIDNDENSLFVVLADSKTIQKIDLVSKKTLGVIDVDEGSYALVIMRER